MRRDTIFYQLFRQSPTLLFDLLSRPPENAAGYIFESIEVKETALDGDEAISEARGFIDRSQGNRGIIDAVSTIMVYKFSNLSRDEVDAMLGIELEQTRVYREAEQQGSVRGRQEEAQSLILRLLKRRLGNVSIADADGKPCDLEARIKTLPLAQLEELGEALLDFSQMTDLVAWLER